MRKGGERLNKKALAVILGTIAIALSVTIVYGIVPIVQHFTYSEGSGPSATLTLAFGSIVPEIEDTQFFDNVLATNDYAGQLIISFVDVTSTWDLVFTACTIEIYVSDGIPDQVSGSAKGGIAIDGSISMAITVVETQEYDYKVVFTPVASPLPVKTLELEIS